ncbi:MAG: response regulator transcription factor [Bacteroidota bacterium]
MNQINILLADTAYLVREGIKSVVAGYPYMRIAGEVTHSQALHEEVSKLQPELVILDYNSPGAFGTEDVREIKDRSVHTQVLVLSSQLQRDQVFRALEYGTMGFLLKECDQTEILGAIHALNKGDKFFCGKVLDFILERRKAPALDACEPTILTERETEVVKLMAEGTSTQNIAERLCLSVHTVYTHRKNVMRKLGVTKAADVILYAINTSLVEKGNN